MFAANLSIALAELGYKTVVVDLDLGGSNLYTYLGLQNKYSGIGDYLKAGNVDFNELIVRTEIPNLSFLPGDGRTPFLADIHLDQRILLTKKIRDIQADYVILDLAAGSHFNTLSFYGISNKGFAVTSIEISSIMNFIMFLRNYIFRVISAAAGRSSKLMDMLIAEFNRPMRSEPLTVNYLLRKIAETDKAIAERIQKLLKNFRPRVIINMGEHPDELEVLKKVDSTIQKSLSVKADFFGFIFYDEYVRRSGKKREVLVKRYPDSIASKSIEHIAKRVVNIWDNSIVNSQESLVEDTRKKYAAWMQMAN